MRAQVRNKRKRTSQFRGVSKAGAKWKATITANGSKQELGRFDSELEAAQCANPYLPMQVAQAHGRWCWDTSERHNAEVQQPAVPTLSLHRAWGGGGGGGGGQCALNSDVQAWQPAGPPAATADPRLAG